MTSIKYDKGKVRMELIPALAERELAKVYTMGAVKYDDWNWDNGGFDWSRIIGALRRHLNSFEVGEDYDDESKLLTMTHVAWCAMTLLQYQLTGHGTDDRYKQKRVLPEKHVKWRWIGEKGKSEFISEVIEDESVARPCECGRDCEDGQCK